MKFEGNEMVQDEIARRQRLDAMEHIEEVGAFGDDLVEKPEPGERCKTKVPQLHAQGQ